MAQIILSKKLRFFGLIEEYVVDTKAVYERLRTPDSDLDNPEKRKTLFKTYFPILDNKNIPPTKELRKDKLRKFGYTDSALSVLDKAGALDVLMNYYQENRDNIVEEYAECSPWFVDLFG